MLYDYRAHGTKAGQLPVFSRASSFVEILISRGRIFHTVAPFLSRSQIFFFFFFCFSLWSQLAASNSFVVQLTIAIALRFIVAYSPVHPSIIIIVSPRYRFGTINKSVFVAQCHETIAATDWSLTFKATLVPRVLHAAAGQVVRPTDRPTERTHCTTYRCLQLIRMRFQFAYSRNSKRAIVAFRHENRLFPRRLYYSLAHCKSWPRIFPFF